VVLKKANIISAGPQMAKKHFEGIHGVAQPDKEIQNEDISSQTKTNRIRTIV
jgi:hypothetical protein